MNNTAVTANTLKAQQIQTVMRIIERVVNSELLKDAAVAEGMSITTFHKVLGSERELAMSYARAKEIRADLLADEALAIVDDETKDANRARNQMTMRQWLAAKLAPKTYGERIDLNVSATMSVVDALAEARQRVRPVSDQRDVVDVEIHAPQALPAPGATDMQSVTPHIQAEPDGEPDIFS